MTTTLRLATLQDAAGVRAVYAPVVERTAISFELVPPTVDEMAARMADKLPRHPWIVAVERDVVLGYAYAGRFSGRPAYDWSVETSVYVGDAARGRGLGRRLYGALLALLQAQGYRRALAGIALPNPGSVALHEALGFAPVGVYRAVGWKHGAWHDVGWWQRAIDARGGDGAPGPILAVDALPHDVVARALAG